MLIPINDLVLCCSFLFTFLVTLFMVRTRTRRAAVTVSVRSMKRIAAGPFVGGTIATLVVTVIVGALYSATVESALAGVASTAPATVDAKWPRFSSNLPARMDVDDVLGYGSGRL